MSPRQRLLQAMENARKGIASSEKGPFRDEDGLRYAKDGTLYETGRDYGDWDDDAYWDDPSGYNWGQD